MKYCALATMGFALAFGFPTASRGTSVAIDKKLLQFR
jgi:hypothetical protein